MPKTIEEARAMLERLGKMQAEGRATGLPCPRCGNPMADPMTHNALSRRATVYICSDCGIAEAIMDMRRHYDLSKADLPLNEWSMIKAFDEAFTEDEEEE